jgi:hypothetical protein
MLWPLTVDNVIQNLQDILHVFMLKVFYQCDNLCFQISNDPVILFQLFFKCFFDSFAFFNLNFKLEIIYSNSSKLEFCVSSFLFSSFYSDLFFFFSIFITSMALNNSFMYSTSTSSYSSYVYSLSESSIAMNRTLSVSLSLTSSVSDEELSSMMQKLFLKTFFLLFFLYMLVCYLNHLLHFFSFYYEEIC